MLIIYSAADQARALKQQLEESIQHNELPPPSVALTDEMCFKIIEAILDDTINHRLKWVRGGTDKMDQRLREFFPYWEVKASENKHARILYDQYLDPLVTKIDLWVDTAIPCSTWDIIYTRRLGKDVIIERGIDYRIADWTRRFEEGEIQLDG